MNLEDAVEVFRENSLAATELQTAGKVAAGNRKADVSHRAYLQLRKTDEGRRRLIDLLDDREVDVQLDVAGRLLPLPEAESALRRWAAVDDLRGQRAASVLRLLELMKEEGVELAPAEEGEEGGEAAADVPPASEADETVVSFHGLVMNGGVAHAIEISTSVGTPVESVLDALRSTGLDDLAELVETVLDDEETDDEMTDRWSDVVPTDAALEARLVAGSSSGQEGP